MTSNIITIYPIIGWLHEMERLSYNKRFDTKKMPMMFVFHNLYDLNSGPILALSQKPSFNTYFKHDIAKSHIPCHHIFLKQVHFHR